MNFHFGPRSNNFEGDPKPLNNVNLNLNGEGRWDAGNRGRFDMS